MTDEILDGLTRDYLGCGFEQCSFAWQGGEPTLMGLDFYKRVIDLQEYYKRPGQVIYNSLQTNAILLDGQWCEFLSEHRFLCGISLDGPQSYHDEYRKDRKGEGTYRRVMEGIENCRKYGVEFNILVLLNHINIQYPDELFDFFTGEGFKYLQFVPCVEKSDADPHRASDFSITPHEYGRFMCQIFDRWLDFGLRNLSIRLFDSIISFLVGGPHTECTFARRCNDYLVIEHHGDAYCCDFYVTEETRLGNVMESSIESLAGGRIKRDFARQKTEIDNKCLICRYLDVCRGGCPKDRAMLTGTHKGPSYFCEGYKQFFEHALPKFELIAQHISRPG